MSFLDKMFSKSKVENTEQVKDPIASLDQQHRNTLNVIRDAYKRTGEFTGEQLSGLSFVKDELESKYGTAKMEEVIRDYMSAEVPSRLEELRTIVDRNGFLKSKLIESLAGALNPNNQKASESLENAKKAVRLLSSETFSSSDVDALCEEIIASEEFTAYGKDIDNAVIAGLQDATQEEPNAVVFKSPYAGDAPRHIALSDKEVIDAIAKDNSQIPSYNRAVPPAPPQTLG